MKDLEIYILEKIINPNNAQKFYLEGIRFSNKNIVKLCEQKVLENFNELCKDGVQKIPQFLKELPFDIISSLLSSDLLCVTKEKLVADLIEAYMKHRDAILPLLPEEEQKPDLVQILTPEEMTKRKEIENKRIEEEKKANDAKAAAALQAFNALTPL